MDMIEKIARTLYNCEKQRADHSDKVMGLSHSTMEPWEECKDTFLSDAADVLIAMREPTADMVIQAERKHGLLEGFRAEDGWRTMIGAALAKYNR